ncbi:glycerol-3-phosphate dehydrogenase/oxidase [Promicromonospora thailandica]|uniref:Glycerol-3-phosphate dehydrogenase n=1 Tax=Promicromonospora thailandica TaxID=765201 RepID=A0A9X2G2R1_9MICO|nr:glycerol-3-phosphate dehydrogenase/oxidase [Promicromonospora thailandica]MCP2264252.1 glycerol-3-phosphate dehydrogenase [Promicromonospora thailandica]BFF21069.1 glycerol-3-phosphate dehydrogenase/oxidase [Promicromonospora thailandica]
MSTALTARRRADELDALTSRTVDVLVVGGGVTGAGAALDAAARGLSVALVEERDLAWGTSRWSSKLAHGGLRYLATGDVGVARESARERHVLMTRTAPHLVRALPQVLPRTPGSGPAQRLTAGVGLGLGDLLRRDARTSSRVLPAPHRARPDEVARLFPAVAPAHRAGAWVAHDGQLVDDARLVVALARTAAGLGAVVLTRTRAVRLAADGATLQDTGTGASLTVRARAVVNATGVWAGTVDPSVRLRPSRGTHVVVPAARLGGPAGALMVPVPGSRGSRYVFALPVQLGRVIVGLTDEEAPGPVPDVPEPTGPEIDFLLRTVSVALDRPLLPDEVVGAYAGLRPLVDVAGSGGAASPDVSRKHLVAVSRATGAVNVLGGKLTTYRAMARDAVDLAVRHAGLRSGPCRTADLPLVGAPGPGDARHLPPGLAARYGAEAATVLASATVAGAADLVGGGAPGTEHLDVTRAEVEWAVTHEGALDADDVLDRRTRIGLVPADREAVADAVREVVDQVLARL